MGNTRLYNTLVTIFGPADRLPEIMFAQWYSGITNKWKLIGTKYPGADPGGP